MLHGNGIIALKSFGDSLVTKLLAQDPTFGGRLCLITGPQGTGKTSLLIHFLLRLYGKETIVWRGRNPDQWYRIPDWMDRCVFFFHENDKPIFYLVDTETNEVEEIKIKYYTYKNAEDLLYKLEDNKINIVYEPRKYKLSDELLEEIERTQGIKITKKDKSETKSVYFWFEFLHILVNRVDRRWISLFLDEVDDIFPETPAGLQWKLQGWLKDSIKDCRKTRISIFASTHTLNNVDYRIRTKFQFFIYLKGAKTSEDSLVNKELVMKLDFGQALIEWGNFGLFQYKPVPLPKKEVVIRIVDNPDKIDISIEKGKIKQAIIQIAKHHGIDKAIEVLDKLKKNKKITRTHYWRIRKELDKLITEMSESSE